MKKIFVFAALTLGMMASSPKAQALASYTFNGCSGGYALFTINWDPRFDTFPNYNGCELTPSYCLTTSSGSNFEHVKCMNLNKPRNPLCDYNYYHNNQPAILRIGVPNNC